MNMASIRVIPHPLAPSVLTLEDGGKLVPCVNGSTGWNLWVMACRQHPEYDARDLAQKICAFERDKFGSG
jgi:hypothetical protein